MLADMGIKACGQATTDPLPGVAAVSSVALSVNSSSATVNYTDAYVLKPTLLVMQVHLLL